MTKVEYYSVRNIQKLGNVFYSSPYINDMRTIFDTLSEEFNSKYKGTPVQAKMNNNNVYRTSIKRYYISFTYCAFYTGIGWGRYFDETTMTCNVI